MELSRNLRVSSTNSNGKNQASVRIYKGDVKVADVQINKRNPLGYLQGIVHGSAYLKIIERQLREHTFDMLADKDGILTLEDWQVLQSEAGLKIHLI